MKRRICFVLYDVSKIGGIWTFQRTLAAGLRKCGCEVDEYLVSLGQVSKKKHGAEGFKEGSNKLGRLGFINDKLLTEFKQKMSEYDAVIMTHCSPHITKAFEDPAWKGCYDIPQPKLVIFHDSLAEYNYPWIRDVKFDYAVAVHGRATISVEYLRNPAVKKAQINLPLDMSDMDTTEKQFGLKENSLIAPHHFKTWKRMHLIVRAIHHQPHHVYLFGEGTEFYYMRRAGYPYEDFGNEKISKATRVLREILASDRSESSIAAIEQKYGTSFIYNTYLKYGNIWKDAVESGKLHHKIFVPRTELVDRFRRSIGIIDMSACEFGRQFREEYRSYSGMNYSTLEGIKFGNLPIATTTSLQEPFTKDDMLLVPEADEDTMVKMLIAQVNSLKKNDEWKETIKRNQRTLQDNFNIEKIAKEYLSLLDGSYNRPFVPLRRKSSLVGFVEEADNI